jgi:hypothetical protein
MMAAVFMCVIISWGDFFWYDERKNQSTVKGARIMPWKRHRPTRFLLYLIPALLAAIVAAVLLGWQFGWFAGPAAPVEIGRPGAAVGDAADLRVAKAEADALSARMIALLKNSATGMLADSYRLAGRFGKPEAVLATVGSAANQLRYGTYLMEQGWEEDFQTWYRDFAEIFFTSEGLVKSQASLAGLDASQADDFWRVNLAALRLLGQSCTLWPDLSRQAALRQLSDLLLAEAGQGLGPDFNATVPTVAPTPDPAATPTPKPTASPPAEPGKTLPVLRLASLDLFTMQQLAQLDSRWQDLYNICLPLVKNGCISDDLPLYALGYSTAEQGYLNYSGITPAVDTEEALLTILHLCEVGEANPLSIHWLRDQLFNGDAIYETYHIAQGQATTDRECVAGYAIIARIARIQNDQDLYDAAVRRLLWHRATSQTSAALSAVFRTGDDGLVTVYAKDNTWTLLAMR